jgi:hypothetical protein
MVNFIYYIGMAIGAPLVSQSAAGSAGWPGALVPLLAVSALGLLVCILFQITHSRASKMA